jgi:hypothetical protein
MAVSFIGEETGVPRENHWPVASHWQTLSYNVVSSKHRHERGSNSQLPYDHAHDGFHLIVSSCMYVVCD